MIGAGRESGGAHGGLGCRRRRRRRVPDRATRRTVDPGQSVRHGADIEAEAARIASPTPCGAQGEPGSLPPGVGVGAARHCHARLARGRQPGAGLKVWAQEGVRSLLDGR